LDDTGEGRWLLRIALQSTQASVLPLVLAVYARVMKPSERTMLLELIEKLNFRYYGCGIAGRSDSGQGELFSLAHGFYGSFSQTDESDEKIDAGWLKRKLQGFVERNANDPAFIEYLTLDLDESGDYFTWTNLKYSLACYEEQLAGKAGRSADLKRMLAAEDADHPNDFYHREHIWAVGETTILDDRASRDVNKRRLGNFVLLEPSINVRVSNDPVEHKVEEYFERTLDVPTTLMLRELKGYYSAAAHELSKEWKRSTWKHRYAIVQRFLDRREEAMLKFALARWGVAGLKSNKTTVAVNSRAGENRIYDSVDLLTGSGTTT